MVGESIMKRQRRILVTAALPYANGPIHLGHLVEYIQTDIWVRFQKLRGHQCIYICADDTHGTAIMIRARQERRSEEELIAEMQQAHLRDFTAFDIEFDNYGSTNSDENRQLCREIWQALRERNLIVERDVAQLYDPEAGTFLADRFVKGTCPEVPGARAIRRQLRQVQCDLSRHRLDRSGQHVIGGQARAAVRATLVCPAGQTARRSWPIGHSRAIISKRKSPTICRGIF